ncbi:MAG: glutamate formimidoyltransferase [Holophagaceae bacterium]|nr:glutamate formimidoyltransferase [Holophagaceae bacterium]
MQGAEKIVECVPNFSEGRDLAKIKQITDAIESVAGVELMDVDPGPATNRTVVTFIGDPEAALEAAFRAIEVASRIIDMSTHHGAHPRMGATDVCPFVPVSGLTLDDCVALADRLGERVGRELAIPVYLYESAAKTGTRRNLAMVRKGEYEGLARKLKDPAWAPDYGPSEFNAKTGGTIIGAREFLIAYNITLNSHVKDHATDLAFELREKGRVARRNPTNAYYSSGEILFYQKDRFPCGNCDHDAVTFEALEAHCQQMHSYDLRHLLMLNDIDTSTNEAVQALQGQKAYRAGYFTECKAIGWVVPEYGRAQLSINLTDYHATPPHSVLDATRQLALDRGLVVTGSEIVGLVPFQALYQAGQHYLSAMGKSPFVPVEDVLKMAVFSMGLSDVSPFDIEKKVIGLPKQFDKGLMTLSAASFIEEVSRDTPAPGGGSIAAFAGSLGAALASMVANLTQGKAATRAVERELLAIAKEAQKVKDALILAVDEDTNAFNGYMEALRLPKSTDSEKKARSEAMQAGLKEAVAVPLSTAVLSLEAMKLSDRVATAGNPNSLTDALVGCAVAYTGVRGGLWNVMINLKDIKDSVFVDEMRKYCALILAEAQSLMGKVGDEGDARLLAMIEAKRK